MKVCFIVGTLGRGGAEKQLVFMLRALRNAGIETRVLCLTKDESYEADIRGMGIEVEYVGKNQNRFARVLEIVRNIRKRPVDIVQSSHFYTNIYAGLAGRALRIPSIGAIRSNLASELKLHGFLGRFQLSLPRFLIANSDLGRRNAIAQGIAEQGIELVRNVVEIESNTLNAASDEQRDLTFLFVGRLTGEKRADRFVRLAAALIKKFPAFPMRFRIAGDGPLREEIEQQEACDSLGQKLEFLGECPDMREIYLNADVLVLTSDYEGSPNVILEAMAHGLPVIATNVGGVSEILNEKCGYLVEPDDETSMVKAAGDLIHSPELRARLGAEGIRSIESRHSLESLSDHLISIYQRLNKRIENHPGVDHEAGQELLRR